MYNSGDGARTREIKKNDKDISWEHIRLLYSYQANTRFKKTKLTARHLSPDSYFKVSWESRTFCCVMIG
jgi:hypothetical protein